MIWIHMNFSFLFNLYFFAFCSFFLYLFLAAVLVLLLVGLQQLFSSRGVSDKKLFFLKVIPFHDFWELSCRLKYQMSVWTDKNSPIFCFMNVISHTSYVVKCDEPLCWFSYIVLVPYSSVKTRHLTNVLTLIQQNCTRNNGMYCRGLRLWQIHILRTKWTHTILHWIKFLLTCSWNRFLS